MGQLRFGLKGGLKTDLSDDGPEFSTSTVNWYTHSGVLKKRGGQVMRRVLTDDTTAGAAYTESGAVTIAGTLDLYIGSATYTPQSSAGDQSVIWMTCAAPFNRVKVTALMTASGQSIRSDGWDMRIPLLYWNGSAFATVYARNVGVQAYDTSGDIATIAPFHVSGSTLTAVAAEFEFVPPSDWAAKTFNGGVGSKYAVGYARVGGFGNNATPTTPTVVCCTTENRVLHLNTWQDRDGTPHEFAVTLSNATGYELAYWLDGTKLTETADFSPDGTSVQFGPDTVVQSIYHGTSDRIIGHVSNYGWFYLIPGDGIIYNFPVSDALDTPDNPYRSIPVGLRGAIPTPEHMTTQDSRIFVARDQTVMWSGFGIYPDVWPNRNEVYLDDGLGPITGMRVLNGVLYVFKRSAIYSMQPNGTNDGDGYDAVPVSNNVGAVGGFAGAGSIMFFMATEGLYLFDGKETVKISSKIDEAFLSGSIGSDLRKARGLYYPVLSQVRYYFPSTSESNVIDKALYIDAGGAVTKGDDEGALSAWPQGKNASTDAGWQFTSVWLDQTGPNAKVIAGDTYGVIWELDAGTLDLGNYVTADMIQMPQGSSQMDTMLVSAPAVSMKGDANAETIKMSIVPDGKVSAANEVQFTTSPNDSSADDATFTPWMTFTTSGVVMAFRYPPKVRKKRANLSKRTQTFQVRVQSTGSGAVEIIGFEVNAVGAGRKSQRSG